MEDLEANLYDIFKEIGDEFNAMCSSQVGESVEFPANNEITIKARLRLGKALIKSSL